MPIIKSAKKALRQSFKRRKMNIKKTEAFKGAIKAVNAFKGSAAEKGEEAKAVLAKAYKALDKAAKTGVIKKKTAARKKSRLARFLKDK